MNIKLIRFVAGKFYRTGSRSRFMSFARKTALISVMLGSMALIISLAVLEGFDSKLRENAIKFTAHISVKSFNRKALPDVERTVSLLPKAFPEVASASMYNERECLVKSKSFVEGVLVRSFNPDNDITNLKANIVEGRFGFSSATANEIVIGKRLANKLGARLGDNITLFALKDGNRESFNPKIDKFTIVGIYETGMAQYDDILLYIPFETSAPFFGMPPGSASGIDVMLHDVNTAPALTERMESYLGFPHYCLTVFDLHRSIFSWIELQKQPIPIVLGLISLVAVLNIITTLLITVVEKTHSIGILRTLGMKRREIVTVFLFQGLTIALTGSVIGAALGWLICTLQQQFGIIKLQGEIYFLDTVPVKMLSWHFEIVIGVTLVFALLSTLAPSFAALKATPLKAIRFK